MIYLYTSTLSSRVSLREIATGIDGCSILCFMITVKKAVYIYSLLAQGSFGENKYKESLGIIQKAMMTCQRMINWDEEFCTDLIYHSEIFFIST